jgi:hypothetical protein
MILIVIIAGLCFSYAAATYLSLQRNNQSLHGKTQFLYRKLLIILIVDVALGKLFCSWK